MHVCKYSKCKNILYLTHVVIQMHLNAFQLYYAWLAGAVAQSVECSTLGREARGSSPSRGVIVKCAKEPLGVWHREAL